MANTNSIALWFPWADKAAPVTFVMGQVGCTISGDDWGLPANGSWGLVY